jgi:Spy/CpxP family protein refolding chaperone
VISRSGFLIAVAAALISGISLGLIAGLLTAHFVRDARMHHGPQGGSPPGVMRLERELNLAPAQRDSVDAIVKRSRGRFEALRDSLRREIDVQLTPAQRDHWHQIERRFPPRHGSWPHPAGGDRR